MEALIQDPVFVVVGILGALGCISWLLDKMALIPRLFVVSGKPGVRTYVTRATRMDLSAQGFTQVAPWLWRKEK